MSTALLNLLKITVSGSVLICVVLVARLLFRKVPKALICILWVFAVVRLLVPFSIKTTWSLQPDVRVVTDRLHSFVNPEEFRPLQMDLTGSVPTLQEIPDTVQQSNGLSKILMTVWLAGMAVMVIYAAISYLRLRLRVGEAERIDDGIYCCPGIGTAFLIGYFRPRIYLPVLQENPQRLVLQHEKAHIRRGDNWLMLAGYLAVCIHWFNPAVWLMYLLLSRDVETACDERVIRDLGVTDRKAYAASLLACRKEQRSFRGCPLAFGEVNLKKRILRVLSHRRPLVWACVLAVICTVLVGPFFLTEPTQKYLPYYEVLIDSLGDPISEICPRLGITEEDLLFDGSYSYETPIFVEYAGVTLQLFLTSRWDLEGERLGRFAYSAIYDGSTEEADRDTVAVLHRLSKDYGPSVNAQKRSEPDCFEEITEEEVTRLFNEKPNTKTSGSISDYWDLTNSGHGNISEYLAEFQTSDGWNYYPLREDARACYMLQINAAYNRESNMKHIYLTFASYADYGEQSVSRS